MSRLNLPTGPFYGELVVIGMNGEPDQYRKNRFTCEEQEESTAVSPVRVIMDQARLAASIPPGHSVIHMEGGQEAGGQDVQVQCGPLKGHQMFQLGRGKKRIDFFVDAPQPYARPTVSRYSARIVVESEGVDNKAQIFAGAFDENQRIFLGENASKTITCQDGKVDAFTANGVAILRPPGNNPVNYAKTDSKQLQMAWREVSCVWGKVFDLRGKRLRPEKDQEVVDSTNELVDGTIIDLGGVSVLWRSRKAAIKADDLGRVLEEEGRKVVSPDEDMRTLLDLRKAAANAELRPHVYLGCGHVASGKNAATATKCSIASCGKEGKLVPMQLAKEPLFFIDDGKLEYCFNPCGHVVNKSTAEAWSNIVFLTDPVSSLCPFCGVTLATPNKFLKLQATMDYI